METKSAFDFISMSFCVKQCVFSMLRDHEYTIILYLVKLCVYTTFIYMQCCLHSG